VNSTRPGLYIENAAVALFTTAIVALMGATLGSSLPAWLAKYVIHDEVRLGYALALTFVICVPIALLAIVFGRKTFRDAIAEADTWAGEQD
jgi:uncharacterized membrane protein YdjX (TVP38/TMEM64 family)